MKKLLCILVAVVALCACSKNTRGDRYVYTDGYNDGYVTADGYGGRYQIIDQEFDNFLAPDTDYDSLCAYELQACGESYLPPAAQLQSMSQIKAAARKVDTATALKSTRAKKVVNTVNVYEVDGPNPTVPVSSKTTVKTVYKDGKVVSSSTTSSGGASAKTTTSGATTTTTSF